MASCGKLTRNLCKLVSITRLLDLRALLGFERWQSTNKSLPGQRHLGSIGGVEASRIEVVLIESAHLVLGRPLGLFQPWMFGFEL